MRDIIEDGPMSPSLAPSGQTDSFRESQEFRASRAFPRLRFRGMIAGTSAFTGRSTAGKGRIMAAHDALRTILPVAGLAEERARAVEFTGGADPVLPTPFRIGETSAAALAATGLAVSDLWELRTGRQAAGRGRSAAGHRLAAQRPLPEMDGAEVSTERNPVMGVYPAKNGRWSYIHANFPNHRAAALSVLGVRGEQGGGAPGGGELGRARARGGDHRRQGRRRHGAQHGRMGASTRRPPRSPRCRCWRSSRSATRRRKSCPKATGRSPASACST